MCRINRRLTKGPLTSAYKRKMCRFCGFGAVAICLLPDRYGHSCFFFVLFCFKVYATDDVNFYTNV